MIEKKILERYYSSLSNSVSYSVKTEQVLNGVYTSVRYLRGCLGPQQYSHNGTSVAADILISQVFQYKNTKIYFNDNLFSHYPHPVYYKGAPYQPYNELYKEISEDKDLKMNLIVKELFVSYKGIHYVYNPAEQILLGEEPCLVEIKPENK